MLVGSHGSLSLLFMMNVMVWHFVGDTHNLIMSVYNQSWHVSFKVLVWSFLGSLVDIFLCKVQWLLMLTHMLVTQIHWFSIFNSFMMVIFLTGLVSMILMRTLRNDYAKYAREEDDLETLVSQMILNHCLWGLEFRLHLKNLWYVMDMVLWNMRVSVYEFLYELNI